MGVDLRLLPIDCLHNDNGMIWGFSHTVLSLPRRSEAWPAFEPIVESLPASHSISSFCCARIPDGRSEGETMYGVIPDRDSYDCKYTWSTAGQLKPVLRQWFAEHAATAYIEALNDDTRVVLDWH